MLVCLGFIGTHDFPIGLEPHLSVINTKCPLPYIKGVWGGERRDAGYGEVTSQSRVWGPGVSDVAEVHSIA